METISDGRGNWWDACVRPVVTKSTHRVASTSIGTASGDFFAVWQPGVRPPHWMKYSKSTVGCRSTSPAAVGDRILRTVEVGPGGRGRPCRHVAGGRPSIGNPAVQSRTRTVLHRRASLAAYGVMSRKSLARASVVEHQRRVLCSSACFQVRSGSRSGPLASRTTRSRSGSSRAQTGPRRDLAFGRNLDPGRVLGPGRRVTRRVKCIPLSGSSRGPSPLRTRPVRGGSVRRIRDLSLPASLCGPGREAYPGYNL
jgi:hypothetical protein